MKNLSNNWTLTDTSPHYFIRELGDESEYDYDYEAISVFSTGNGGLLVSHHLIDISNVPRDEFEEFLDEITLKDIEMKMKYAIETSLNQGYGQEESLGHFDKDELEDLNELISSKNIEFKFEENDFD